MMMMMILQPNLTVISFRNINEMKYELKKYRGIIERCTNLSRLYISLKYI